jgi:hypothetical protein
MRVEEPAGGFEVRLDEVDERLQALAARPPAIGLTEPDPGATERWDWGQVWAHMAEFPTYWMGQIQSILDQDSPEPVPFGRTKADEGRLAAIEADRSSPVADLWGRVSEQIRHVKVFVADIDPEAWDLRGAHPTLGMKDIRGIVEEFLVGHLEEHAAQLEALSGT